MRRELFDYVEQIRVVEKNFDTSVVEIRRMLMVKGRCDLYCDVDVIDERGLPVIAPLRLNIAGGPDRPLTSWTLALKLHNVRIDGIDHEFRFKAADGNVAKGWHRHYWDAAAESAKRQKVPIADLDQIASAEDFLFLGLNVLNIKTNSVSDGLQFT